MLRAPRAAASRVGCYSRSSPRPAPSPPVSSAAEPSSTPLRQKRTRSIRIWKFVFRGARACHGSKRSRTDGRRADAAGAGEASGQRRIQAGRLCRGASGDSFKEPPCTLSGHSLAPLVNVAAQRGEACFLALWVAMTLRDSVGARALARVLDCACSITRARYKSAETTTSCAQIAQVLRIRKWPPCTI